LAGIVMLASVFLITAWVGLASHRGQGTANHGTIKVEDEQPSDPGNDPKVDCDFFIEGKKMAVDSGTLEFWTMPPDDGEEEFVAELVMTASWDADAETRQGWDFIEGPFSLPSGHYKVLASNAEDHYKSKVFKAECDVPAPECPEDDGAEESTNTGPEEEGPRACDGPDGEIPFFPTTAAVLLGSVGALGGAGLLATRGRRL
jgi:hypothetical protein